MAPPRSTRPRRFLIFVVAYFLAIRLSEHAYGSLAVPSPFWLPDAVLLCALLLAPRPQWWIFVLAIWPVRVLAGAVPGTPLWFQLVAILNDMSKGLVAAWILSRLTPGPLRLQTVRELNIFLGVAAVFVPAMSAMAAAPARAMLGDAMWPAAGKWFLGNAVTQIVVTPPLLYWCTTALRSPSRRLELLVVYAGLVVTLVLGFIVDHPSYSLVFVYLPVPFLVWAALRAGPFGTAIAVALVAVASMLAAVRGTGIFAGAPPEHSVQAIQVFLIGVGVVLLSLAIVTAERETLIQRESAFSGLLIAAQEEERARLARDLHDDVAQRTALLQIGIAELARGPNVTEDGRTQATSLAKGAADISATLHGLSHALHPATIEILGLEDALAQLGRSVAERYGLRVDVDCRDVPTSLDPERSICLYRIAQEALANAAKHSGARVAAVALRRETDGLVLSVSDAGQGFDPAGRDHQRGLGLVSMRERVRPFRGTVIIDAAPQRGTRVRVHVPLS